MLTWMHDNREVELHVTLWNNMKPITIMAMMTT